MIKIYTRDEAAILVDMFDKILVDKDICVPSPEDDERGEDNMVGLYGTTFWDLLDEVEEKLIELLERVEDKNIYIVKGEFSGNA